MTKNKTCFISYLTVTFILTASFLIIGGMLKNELLLALSQAAPFIGMILTGIPHFGKKLPSKIGLNKTGHIKWYIFSFFVPLIAIGLSYSLTTVFGFTKIMGVETSMINLSNMPDITLSILKMFFTNLLSLIPMTLLWSAGEEFGWRGYMQPILTEKFGITKGLLISGLIWAAYHYVFIFSGNYFAGGTVFIHVILFTVLAVVLSFIMGLIRIRSNSLYPVILFHSMINTVQMFFDYMIFQSVNSNSIYLVTESGLVNILFWMIVLFFMMLKKEPKIQS